MRNASYRGSAHIFLTVIVLVSSFVPFVFVCPSLAASEGELGESSAPATESVSEMLSKIGSAESRNYAEAESLAVTYLRAVQLRHDSRPADVAALMARVVSTSNYNGKTGEDILALARRVVAIQDSLPDIALRERSRNRRELANLHRQRREYVLAIAEARRGLDVIRSETVDDVYESYFLSLIGVSSRRSGDIDGARLAFSEAIDIESRIHDEPTLQLGSLQGNLGNLFSQMNDYSAALEQYQNAIDALEWREDTTSKSVLANMHRNTAIIYYQQHRNAEAIHHLDLALSTFQDVLRPDHPKIGDTLLTISRNALSLSDYPRATETAKQGLEIYRSNGSNQTQGQMEAFLALAEIARRLGDVEQFESYLFEVADLQGDTGISSEFQRVYEQNLGLLRLKQDRLDEALTHFEQAVAIANAPGSDDSDWYIPSIYLAMCHVDRSEFPTARDLYRQIIERRTESMGEYSSAYENYRLALCYNAMGYPDSALVPALSSESQTYERMRGQSSGLPEATALGLVSQKYNGLDLSISLIDDVSRDVTGQVWDRVVLSRAVVYEELASRSRGLVFSDDPAVASLVAKLSSVRERLANTTVKGPGSDGKETHLAELDQLAQQKEDLELKLVQAGADLRTSGIAEVTGAQVRSSLPAGSALVSFVRYHEVDGADLIDPAYVAFVTTADHCDAFFLGSSERIEGAVLDWWDQAAYGGGAHRGITEVSSDGSNSYKAAGQTLRRLIWDPLEGAIGDAAVVFVVPDGKIHHVSFLGLPEDDGSYLVESGVVLHTLSAERDLAKIVGDRGKVNPPTEGQGLLALGGADFFGRDPAVATTDSPGLTPDTAVETEAPVELASLHFRGSTTNCPEFTELQFAHLDGSARETSEIAELWNELHSADHEPRALLLQGSRATESAFKDAASGHSIVHLATHGFFLGGDCVRTLGGRTDVSEIGDQQILRENPLLLSGLALAGANLRAEEHDHLDDGILTAEEIAAIDLRGVDWAVLSACETGAGTILSGEGVLGLRRAFALAGAKSVVMSLWSVEDEATREWMGALYRYRFGGASTADAVREASLAVLRNRRERGESDHPFYWASFVATGSWY